MLNKLVQRIPIVDMLKGYRSQHLRGDLTAGLTTAVMLIPQAMAYAMLAGLPPIVGLYASIVPLALYALLGTSRQLAVGPVAMVSLLVATGVSALAPANAGEYAALAVLLAAMVGVMQIAMGVARLGFLTNFLSHPVVSGFTSAAALIIGFSQLKHLLGVNLERSHHVHAIVLQAFERMSEINPATLTIGAASVVALLALKRWLPRFPSALALVALSTAAVALLRLDQQGVAIVGEVPAGLPPLTWPQLDLEAAAALLPTALTISLVGFMESISVARAFARRNRYEIDSNQELIGLGLANVGAALFRGYPVTGGFSRTAVNAEAGARTTLASIVTASAIALTLVFLTPLFHFLPKAVLAAIIMTAVFGLIDLREVRHLWAVKRTDLALLSITFIGTLSLGIEQGIALGVGTSMFWFVARTTRPHFALLGRLPGTDHYRNIARYSDAERFPGLMIVRMDAQFYFGNTSFLRSELRRLEALEPEPVTRVIIDASSINALDSSAAAAISELVDEYASRGISLYLAGLKGPVKDVLARAHLLERFPASQLPFDVATAVRTALDEPSGGALVAPPPPPEATPRAEAKPGATALLAAS